MNGSAREAGRRHLALGSILAVATISLVLTARPGPVDAQPSAADDGQRWLIHYDAIEPGRETAHEANVGAWVAAFTEANLGESWGWYAFAGPDSTYAYRSRLGVFAELDAEDDRQLELLSVLGDERVAALRAGATAIASHRTEVVQDRPDLGYLPEDGATSDPGILRIASHHVRPTRTEAFEEFARQVALALQRSGSPLRLSVQETRLGEHRYLLTLAARDADQLRSQPPLGELLRRSLGDAATTELLADWRDSVTRYESANWLFRPDLSYLPTTTDP